MIGNAAQATRSRASISTSCRPRPRRQHSSNSARIPAPAGAASRWPPAASTTRLQHQPAARTEDSRRSGAAPVASGFQSSVRLQPDGHRTLGNSTGSTTLAVSYTAPRVRTATVTSCRARASASTRLSSRTAFAMAAQEVGRRSAARPARQRGGRPLRLLPAGARPGGIARRFSRP